ncbi:MAG: NAD-dependent epimerase/dehydratase family protein [Reyranella sp.]
MARQKILITGGRGFIGTNLMRRIRATSPGSDLVVLDNGSMTVPGLPADGSIVDLDGDVRDLDAVKHAAGGCTTIVHLAGQTRVVDSIQDPVLGFEVNARGTLNVLLAARECGVDHVVLASTGGAMFGDTPGPIHEDMLPRPSSPYGASKLAMEGYAQAFAGSYGLQSAVMRFANVYGPHSTLKGSIIAHLFRQVLAREPITIYGDGSQARDFVFVDDLCDGIVQAMDAKASGIFHLGSGSPTSLTELLDKVGRVIGPGWPLDVRYAPWRMGEVRRTHTSIAKAARAFGYSPKTGLEAGLQATWQWFLDRAR